MDSLVLRCVAVKLELVVECHCGNNDGQLVACERFGRCKPCLFFLLRLFLKSELYLFDMCGRLLACGQVGWW
jgi:hypothetical protein